MSGNYWIASQLFLHESEIEKLTLNGIKQSILKAKEHMGLDSLIIHSTDMRITEKTIAFCRENEIDSYLWFPILADSWNFKPNDDELLLQHTGKWGNGTIGAWESLIADGEEFRFVCPNNYNATNRIFNSYQYLLERLDYDGVMLDRIRYPSCASGFESLFTCFCEHCKSKFEKSFGYSIEKVSKKITRFFTQLQNLDKAALKEWTEMQSLLNPVELEDQISFKKQNVVDVVSRFSEFAKSRGLIVGLDLYSPSIAPTVFQDYSMLSAYCDWIKPMLYCHVKGPAGLPFEIDCLWRALGSLNSSLAATEIKSFFERALRQSLPENRECLLKQGVPEEILQVELSRIKAEKIADDVRIYPGIEAVQLPEYGVDITPQIMEKYLAPVKKKSEGIIASWNLPSISEENLKLIGKTLK